MAKRSDHTKNELKVLAIAAGQKVIIDQGLSQFSLRKVSKEMGYTVGTVCNILGTYDDIVQHIDAVTLDDMYDDISKYVDSSDHNINTIKNLAILYLNFANHNYNRWCALLEFSLPKNVTIPHWYLHKIEALFSLIEAPLLPLMKQNKKDTQSMAKILWASIHGLCQLGLTGKLNMVQDESVEELINTCIDKFILGLR